MNTTSREHRPTLIRQWTNDQITILVTSILYPFRVWVQTYEVMPTASGCGYLASESSYANERDADAAFNALIKAQEHRTIIKPEIFLQSLHDGMHVIVTVKQKGIDWLAIAELKNKEMHTIGMCEREYRYGGWPSRNEMLTDIIDLVQQNAGINCVDVRNYTDGAYWEEKHANDRACENNTSPCDRRRNSTDNTCEHYPDPDPDNDGWEDTLMQEEYDFNNSEA